MARNNVAKRGRAGEQPVSREIRRAAKRAGIRAVEAPTDDAPDDGEELATQLAGMCGTSRVATHEELLRGLRERVVAAFNAKGCGGILGNSVVQASMELKVISEALINYDGEIMMECGFAIDAVRERLELARELDSGMWHPDKPADTHLGPPGGAA